MTVEITTLKEKKNLLKVIAKEIFKLLKNKERAETENELQGDFFIEILFSEIMGKVYKYKEARGLPELGEIKTHTTVRDFIVTVKGYYDTLNPDGKASLIAFIVNRKVTGAGKTKIGSPEIRTIEELKNLLNEKCGQAETEATLTKKLIEGKQGNKTVEKYAEEVTEITDRLMALKMKDLNLPARLDLLFSFVLCTCDLYLSNHICKVYEKCHK
jgi:hypothetical protein